MMDAVIARAAAGDYPVDHPVLWLDADTTFIRATSFASIVERVESNQVGIFRPELKYTVDWLNGDEKNLDDATRALVIDEIMRRRARKKSGFKDVEDEYLQESGTYFPLSVYMLAGGIERNAYETSNLLY